MSAESSAPRIFRLPSDEALAFSGIPRYVFGAGCLILVVLSAWWLLVPPMNALLTNGQVPTYGAGWVGQLILGAGGESLLLVFAYTMLVRFGEPATGLCVTPRGIELRYRTGKGVGWLWSDPATRIHLMEATEADGKTTIKLSHWKMALCPMSEEAVSAILDSAESAGLDVRIRTANKAFRKMRYLTISRAQPRGQ